MALTKPRASQIYDIDYKQATRVITTTDINLTGGAPNQVDGVNLSLDDRVLVIGQSTGSQNGIYFVDAVGTGSNGTWIRSRDTDTTGELLSGTIVMVTEGLIYADTQWKLTTDNPIVIGTTALTFEQNSAFAFGNVYANNTAVLATSVGDSLILSAGNNIAITGNNTSKTVSIGVTGISLNSISNGTSNVNVVSSGGNVTVGIAGTSNVAVFNSTGVDIVGNIDTGNLSISGSVGSDLVPSQDIAYSLGNATNRWSNLYLSGNTIYLGNSIITESPNGDIVIENSGSFAVPVGTTAQRSEIQGAIRYNTTVGGFETFNGAGWNILAYGTITDFPFGDYGDLQAVTTDAFGVSLAQTFDCNSEGSISVTNLGDGEPYVGG
jgi:hypothetical protein